MASPGKRQSGGSDAAAAGGSAEPQDAAAAAAAAAAGDGSSGDGKRRHVFEVLWGKHLEELPGAELVLGTRPRRSSVSLSLVHALFKVSMMDGGQRLTVLQSSGASGGDGGVGVWGGRWLGGHL